MTEAEETAAAIKGLVEDMAKKRGIGWGSCPRVVRMDSLFTIVPLGAAREREAANAEAARGMVEWLVTERRGWKVHDIYASPRPACAFPRVNNALVIMVVWNR